MDSESKCVFLRGIVSREVVTRCYPVVKETKWDYLDSPEPAQWELEERAILAARRDGARG